jgi:hypothetical protein
MSLPDRPTLATYGGRKQNYLSGVTDTTTDRDADQVNECYADVAGMARVTDFAYAQFTTHATTPVLVRHRATWGSGPSVAPAVSRVSTGRFRLTWDATVDDELAVTHAVAFTGGRAEVNSAAALIPAVVPDVYLYDAAGALTDSAGALIGVRGC